MYSPILAIIFQDSSKNLVLTFLIVDHLHTCTCTTASKNGLVDSHPSNSMLTTFWLNWNQQWVVLGWGGGGGGGGSICSNILSQCLIFIGQDCSTFIFIIIYEIYYYKTSHISQLILGSKEGIRTLEKETHGHATLCNEFILFYVLHRIW